MEILTACLVEKLDIARLFHPPNISLELWLYGLNFVFGTPNSKGNLSEFQGRIAKNIKLSICVLQGCKKIGTMVPVVPRMVSRYSDVS